MITNYAKIIFLKCYKARNINDVLKNIKSKVRIKSFNNKNLPLICLFSYHGYIIFMSLQNYLYLKYDIILPHILLTPFLSNKYMCTCNNKTLKLQLIKYPVASQHGFACILFTRDHSIRIITQIPKLILINQNLDYRKTNLLSSFNNYIKFSTKRKYHNDL